MDATAWKVDAICSCEELSSLFQYWSCFHVPSVRERRPCMYLRAEETLQPESPRRTPDLVSGRLPVRAQPP